MNLEKDQNFSIDMGMCGHGDFSSSCEICKKQEEFFKIDQEKERGLTEYAEKIIERLIGTLKNLGESEFLNIDDVMTKVKMIVAKIKEAWPEHNNARWRPEFNLSAVIPELSNMTLKIYHNDSEAGLAFLDGVPDQFQFGFKDVSDAKNLDDFKKALQRLTETIYHETEHLQYPGPDKRYGFEYGDDEYVRYLTDPGEIRANAKQFAFRFVTEYPGQFFDIEKMNTIAARQVIGKKYFIEFNSPETRDKFRHIADVAAVREKMIELTAKFVEHFNNRKK